MQTPPPVTRRTVALALILFISCGFGLNAAGIFDRDEGLYSTAARQMLASGDWIVPRIGPDVRFAKPPLIYWLQASCIWLLGPTPLAARLPSALAAMLTSLMLYTWARRRGQVAVGWLAAVIYALCPLVMIQARQGITDSLLTCCFTLTVIGWIEGDSGQRRGFLAMAVGAALATLTKGVIGFLLPGAVLVAWPLWRREPARLRRVPWLAMLAIFLVIVVPWHLMMWHATGPNFFREYFLSNHLDRFLGHKYGHQQKFWFYLPILLVGMFPWSVFVPVAWWRGWQATRATPTNAAMDFDSVLGMWVLWATAVIVFFSLSKSKLPEYCLPALPALSLLVAVRLTRVAEQRNGLSRWEAAASGFVGVALGVGLVAVGLLGLRLRSDPTATLWGKAVTGRAVEIASIMAPFGILAGAVFIGGTLVMLLCWTRPRHVAATAISMNLVFIVLAVRLALTPWSRYDIEPLHNLGRASIPSLERGEPLVIYGLTNRRTSLRYVVGHTPLVTETETVAELTRIVGRSPHGTILTRQEIVLPCLPAPLHVAARDHEWILRTWG